MSDIAIKVEGLSKLYKIGSRQNAYKTLRESIMSGITAPFRFMGKARGNEVRQNSLLSAPSSSLPFDNDHIWALKDVSFEVKKGEVIGIIGRNGAGKSTLLKILSRITEPTEGYADIYGRVGSLLEVGTGFHPELTGRENIFLNGAILGMKKQEIDQKFDEIVAFAEVEKFIDTPVKYYSSGMYLRLAFAVAAHLEPEILLVDEVLAVGDTAFQKKCLGKMGEVAKEGRTVLFVSHNMAAVKCLCQKAVLLTDGCITHMGISSQVVSKYMNLCAPTQFCAHCNVETIPRVRGNGVIRIVKITLRNSHENPASSFSVWEPIIVDMEVQINDNSRAASFWILLNSSDGVTILSSFQYDTMEPVKFEHARGQARVYIDPNGLCPGSYSISAGAFGKHNEFFDWISEVMRFEVRQEFHSGKLFDHRLGETTFRYRWDVS